MAFPGPEDSLVAPRVADSWHMIRRYFSMFRGLAHRLLAVSVVVP